MGSVRSVIGLACVCLAIGAGLGACRKGGSPAIDLTGAAGAKPGAGKPEPAEEPSERVLKALLQKDYEQITDAGGMPVVVTATGRQLVLKPRLHDARKESCRKLPPMAGGYECGMEVMVTLRDGDRTPSKSGERLFVHWDADKGEWASGQAPRPKK